MRIAFHSNQLSYRGTEVNLKNLATFNQTILNNESFIIAPAQCNNEGEYLFKDFRIDYINYKDNEYEEYCKNFNIDYLYCIKGGWRDFCEVRDTKQINHFVYGKNWNYQGHRCAFISEFCVNQANEYIKSLGDNYHNISEEEWCVPFYVNKLNETNEDYRKEFNISRDQIVFGYHGGATSFDITWVQKKIIEIVSKNKKFVFIFMGVKPFALPDNSFYKNIIFFEPTINNFLKHKFINTCDAMIHARKSGESFGLSVGEFSLLNKPVLTYNKFNSNLRPVENLSSDYDIAHIEYLKERGWYYRNPAELEFLIQNFQEIKAFKKDIDYASCYKLYNDPNYIMERFSKVFLSD